MSKMKRIILCLLLVVSATAVAQRYDNSISLHSKYGIMKGEGTIIPKMATTASLGIQWFIGQKGYFLESNAIMQDFSIDYDKIEQTIPYQLYGLNIMGGWSYEELNPVFFNVKAGGFAGYYMANKGMDKDSVYNTTFVNSVQGITYGAVASVEAEVVIWKKLTGVVSFSQYYYPTDKWIKWQYAIEGGFKWYF